MNSGSPKINSNFISIQNFDTLKGGQEQLVERLGAMSGEETDKNSVERQEKPELYANP